MRWLQYPDSGPAAWAEFRHRAKSAVLGFSNPVSRSTTARRSNEMAFIPPLTQSLPTTLLISVVLFFVIYVGYSFRSYAKLSHIPGPFLAAWSNLPRMYWVWTRDSHLIHTDLHKKYGKLVRLGPNSISCGDPAEIPNIYAFNGRWIKVDTSIWT